MVAVNQACEGEKRWYTRLRWSCSWRVPTLHVRVETGGTPPMLRSGADAQRPNRVPRVRSVSLTWSSGEPIAPRVESWDIVQQLPYRGGFNQPIVGVTWPACLRQLLFGDSFNLPILAVIRPASLEQLVFGLEFNQPVVGVVWPDSLEYLSLGQGFDQPHQRNYVAGQAFQPVVRRSYRLPR